MPRRIVELSDHFPYHICARTNNRDWFEIPLSTVFCICANVLRKTVQRYEIEVHLFLLMSNHYHMLVSTPQSNISKSMRYFMTETSRSVARSSNRINRIFGARYHWTIIRSSEHFAFAYKYICRNPVRANITERVESYNWSLLNSNHEQFRSIIKNNRQGFGEYIPGNYYEQVRWLNHEDGKEHELSVRKALKKHEFRFVQNQNTGKIPSYVDSLPPKNTPGT